MFTDGTGWFALSMTDQGDFAEGPFDDRDKACECDLVKTVSLTEEVLVEYGTVVNGNFKKVNRG